MERCRSIDQQERSAAAVATSAGVVYRIAASEFISPFVRANVGFLINNQSPLLVVGETNAGAELVIYDDNNKGTRLRPAFVLGVGATVAAEPGLPAPLGGPRQHRRDPAGHRTDVGPRPGAAARDRPTSTSSA